MLKAKARYHQIVVEARDIIGLFSPIYEAITGGIEAQDRSE